MKKYLIWAIGAVALIAVIIGASTLYSKLSEEYKPAGGGIEELPPWDGGNWGAQPTDPEEEPAAPSDVESKPTEPSESDPEPEISTPTESESDEVSSETPKPPQSDPETPALTEPETPIPTEPETPAPTEPETPAPTEPETPAPTEPETPAPTEPETPAPTEPETPKEEPPVRPTLKAPDFTVLDMEGNTVKLSEYTGKPIVINFWATWCGYCDREMPDFERMYKKYGDRVNFLMVNAGNESVNAIKNYISKNGYTFPVFYDAFNQAATAYDASGLPTTYFFFGDGTPGYRGVGMLDGETLEDTILKILG